MFSYRATIAEALRSYRLDGRLICYNSFIPKLYNWCLALGFDPERLIPSRAFCSDENQGFPIILMAKHFGAFPFNHGRVGGIVSVDRHGPHADHGKELLLVQASHVGYEPETGEFGVYRRTRTVDGGHGCSCGKIGHIIERFQREYRYAIDNIRLTRYDEAPALLIDNCLVAPTHTRGLMLEFSRLVRDFANGRPVPVQRSSTGHIFRAAPALIERLGEGAFPEEDCSPIGVGLAPEDFHFADDAIDDELSPNQLEHNLLAPMSWILTSRHPHLTAAIANTQVEFDRTYRSLAIEPAMRGRNLLFVSGLNIDISPKPDEDFPLTKFVPWAAYLQRADGSSEIFEQDEVIEQLGMQSSENPKQIDLEKAIAEMSALREVVIKI
jgi:hypothetical protein